MVDLSSLKGEERLLSSFIEKLGDAGLTAEMLEAVNKDPELAKVIINVLEQKSDLVHGLFTRAGKQVEKMREWNRDCEWGISDEAFVEVEKFIPEWPEENLVAIVLVPYLADEKSEYGTVTGLRRTFDELSARAMSKPKQKMAKLSTLLHKFASKIRPSRAKDVATAISRQIDAARTMLSQDLERISQESELELRLLSGSAQPSTNSGQATLRWELIDLGCQRNEKPRDVRSVKSSPHAGILAAAALHPQWVRSMDGVKVPYVCLPGYECNIPGDEPWAGVLTLREGIELRRYDHCDPGMAVPAFFQK